MTTQALVDALERALQCAYSGSARHGSFLRKGGGEYVPSVFLTLNELRDALAAERAALEKAEQHVCELLQAVNARTSERDQARDAIKTREQFFEESRVSAYRAARIWEPNMDAYNAAMAVYEAAFGAAPSPSSHTDETKDETNGYS